MPESVGLLQQIPKSEDVAWELGRDWQKFEKHDNKCLDDAEQTVNRNKDVKDYSSEGSEEVSMIEKSVSHLKEFPNYCVQTVNRTWVFTSMLLKTQKEMMKILLEGKREEILVAQWQ